MKREDDQGDVRFARPYQDEVISWLKGAKWHNADVIKVLAKEFSP